MHTGCIGGKHIHTYARLRSILVIVANSDYTSNMRYIINCYIFVGVLIHNKYCDTPFISNLVNRYVTGGFKSVNDPSNNNSNESSNLTSAFLLYQMFGFVSPAPIDGIHPLYSCTLYSRYFYK